MDRELYAIRLNQNGKKNCVARISDYETREECRIKSGRFDASGTAILSFGLSSMLITIIATRLNLETGRSPS